MGELGAALLWLRNHFEYYDLKSKKDKKLVAKILNAVDIILLGDDKVNPWVTIQDYQNFREKWLKEVKNG